MWCNEAFHFGYIKFFILLFVLVFFYIDTQLKVGLLEQSNSPNPNTGDLTVYGLATHGKNSTALNSQPHFCGTQVEFLNPLTPVTKIGRNQRFTGRSFQQGNRRG
jgi:hypothetical protein